MEKLIEQIIEDAQADGVFDDLPGAGKPLAPQDNSQDALISKLMTENRAEPAFVSLSRELRRLREELSATGEPVRRHEIMKEMSMMDARIAMARKAFGS